jgi:LysR family transcriptional regulator, nitrogen assimilation regulatory protein
MNLRRLTYFIRVAELGSLNRASEALRIAQPALSRQIRMLEEELGVVLFERTVRGMKLTEQGDRLRAEVAGPLRQLDFAFGNVRLSGNQIAGALDIGMTPELRGILAGPLLGRILSEEPGIAVRIVEGEVDHLAEWAVRGELDLIAFAGVCPHDGVIDRPLLVEDLVLVGAADSDLRADVPVRFDDLTRLPMVLPQARGGIVPLLEKPAYVNKATLDVVLRVNSLELLKDVVGRGLGYTVLPLSAIGREVENGLLRYAGVLDPGLSQEVCIGATRECRVPRLVGRVDLLIRNTMADLVGEGAWTARLLFDPASQAAQD